jgi:hypothetical protein
MSRWPVLAMLSVGSLLAGCAPAAVHPGLANAPRLGGSAIADERVHDVISNGDDACGRNGEHGVLRGRLPPCPGVTHPIAATWLAPSAAAKDDSLVLPWLEHFYAGWPCPRTRAPEPRSLAWNPPVATVCATP